MPTLFIDHPLLCALLVVVIDSLLLQYVIPKAYRKWRLAVQITAFALYSKILFTAKISPLLPAPWPEEVADHLAATLLEINWWMMMAWTLTLAINTIFLAQPDHKSRLLNDLLNAAIFILAAIAAAAYVMNLPVKGLLATSGALAIIVGLALQSTLSDVFSGIVLNTTKPYTLNDWIVIEDTEGKVIEINWRSTLLVTSSGTVIIIPNSLIAKTKIKNLSRPTHIHGITIAIEITPEARPRAVLNALEQAIQGCSELRSFPTASAKLKEVHPMSVKYEINAYVDSMDKKTRICNLLYDLAYRHLAAAGIHMENLTISRPEALVAYNHQRQLLDGVRIFRSLTLDEKEQLSEKMVGHEIPAGHVIIPHGEIASYLLIIDSGVVTVSLATANGTHVEAGRMGPREVIGEVGIMKDTPMTAYISALTTTLVYRIEKADLLPFIQARAEVGDALSNLINTREQSGQTVLAEHEATPSTPKNFFSRFDLNWRKRNTTSRIDRNYR